MTRDDHAFVTRDGKELTRPAYPDVLAEHDAARPAARQLLHRWDRPLTVVAQPDLRTTAAARGLPAPGTRVVDRLVTDRTRHGVVQVYDEYWYQGMSFPVIFDDNGIWDIRQPDEVTIMPTPDDRPGGTR